MPRDFIPNVDDANAEVARLDSQLATLTTEKTKATNDLTAAQELLTESQADVTRLTGENTELTTENAALKSDKTKLEGDLQTEKTKATKTIAKSGTAPATEKSASVDSGKESKPLRGLQRAIAGNAAAHAPAAQ